LDEDQPTTKTGPIAQADYEALAAFRYALRRFLAFSEDAARGMGLTAQQHQAILTIKGFGGPVTVGNLADHLLIRPHSAVELVDRLVQAELVSRAPDEGDRRRVVIALTPQAEDVLQALSATHLEELGRNKAFLVQLLERLGGS
jgi:DNA-binding MarR family transcriptional regulator